MRLSLGFSAPAKIAKLVTRFVSSSSVLGTEIFIGLIAYMTILSPIGCVHFLGNALRPIMIPRIAPTVAAVQSVSSPQLVA